MSIQLRPYQIEARDKLFQAMREGHKRILWVMPTGAGKRISALWLCRQAIQQSRRFLFITNRRLLVSQMYEGAEDHGIEYSIIMAGEEPGNAPIQIASLQTLESRYTRDRWGLPTPDRLPPCDGIIVDEIHGDTERYLRLLAMYLNDPVLIGLTATPVGAEGRSLVPPFTALVEGCLNTDLIRRGVLMQTRVLAPSEPNIEGVKVDGGREFNQKALGRNVRECTVFGDVFKEWLPFADRPAVCFVPGVAYGRDLEAQFNFKLGRGAAHLIYADTKQRDREAAFDAVADGSAKILISVDVLREGFDLPELSLALDLQPNKQFRTYWQKVGRIKRSHPNKRDAVLLDLAGNYWRFPHPDEDPEWPTGNDDCQDVIERNRTPEGAPKPFMCPGCGEVRTKGKKCPRCGFECGEPIRRIRMGDGTLVEVPLHAKKKREKSEAEIRLGKWQSCLYAGLYRGMTLGQCARMYQDKMGQFPQNGWPGVHGAGSLEWKRRVRDCFNHATIAIHCRRAADANNAS